MPLPPPQPCLALVVTLSLTSCSPVKFLGQFGYSGTPGLLQVLTLPHLSSPHVQGAHTYSVVSPTLLPSRTALDTLPYAPLSTYPGSAGFFSQFPGLAALPSHRGLVSYPWAQGLLGTQLVAHKVAFSLILLVTPITMKSK